MALIMASMPTNKNAQPHHDLSKQLEAGPVAPPIGRSAPTAVNRTPKFSLTDSIQGGHGGADIGAHDDPDGLAQGPAAPR